MAVGRGFPSVSPRRGGRRLGPACRSGFVLSPTRFEAGPTSSALEFGVLSWALRPGNYELPVPILFRYILREVVVSSLIGTLLFTFVLFLKSVGLLMELLIRPSGSARTSCIFSCWRCRRRCASRFRSEC